MKKITRTAFLLSLVLVLIASMTATAVAARPENPGQQGRERAASKNGAAGQGASQGNGAAQVEGEISPQAVEATYTAQEIFDQENGWSRSGGWSMERYSGLFAGGADIIVGNKSTGDTSPGDTISRTFTSAEVNGKYIKIYSARYWSCGDMRVKVVRVNRGGQEDIISDETIQLQHGQFPPAQTPGVDDWLVECVDTIMCTGGNHQFILTIEVLGTGGPGSIEIGGETIDFPYNFANVVKVEIDTEP